MMVIFLVGMVWMILLRTLSKDYARYHKVMDVEMDLVKFFNTFLQKKFLLKFIIF